MTSSYRRNTRYWGNTPTSVGIYWSQQYDAYAIKFMDTYHFKEMSPFISYFKSKPYGDAVYDPDGKIWYFKEQYLSDVRAMLAAFGDTIYEVNFVEKPVGGHSLFASPQISVNDYLNKFKDLTGMDLNGLLYDKAKKVYRQACLKLHPDHNPSVDSSVMSSVNEIWTALEKVLYNTKKEPTQYVE